MWVSWPHQKAGHPISVVVSQWSWDTGVLKTQTEKKSPQGSTEQRRHLQQLIWDQCSGLWFFFCVLWIENSLEEWVWCYCFKTSTACRYAVVSRNTEEHHSRPGLVEETLRESNVSIVKKSQVHQRKSGRREIIRRQAEPLNWNHTNYWCAATLGYFNALLHGSMLLHWYSH